MVGQGWKRGIRLTKRCDYLQWSGRAWGCSFENRDNTIQLRYLIYRDGSRTDEVEVKKLSKRCDARHVSRSKCWLSVVIFHRPMTVAIAGHKCWLSFPRCYRQVTLSGDVSSRCWCCTSACGWQWWSWDVRSVGRKKWRSVFWGSEACISSSCILLSQKC